MAPAAPSSTVENPPLATPPPGFAEVSPPLSLAVRLLTLVFLLISLVLIATDNYAYEDNDHIYEIKAVNFYSYRYLLSAAVTGFVYTLSQVISNAILVTTGNRIGNQSRLLFNFYADKVLMFILATGAAASLVLSVQFNVVDKHDPFMNKATAASVFCLLGALFATISSIFSSFSLPKRS